MNVSIRVKGHLDPSWQVWLEELQIIHETDGTSRLFGPLQDQPALYGVPTKIGRLNLTLLSLESSELTHKERKRLFEERKNKFYDISYRYHHTPGQRHAALQSLLHRTTGL